MGNYDGTVNPYNKGYMAQAPPRKKAHEHSSLTLEVTGKTTAQSYKHDVRGFFYYKFNEENPPVEGLKTKEDKIKFIDNLQEAIVQNKEIEWKNTFIPLDAQYKQLNCVVMDLESTLDSLGKARQASSVTRGPLSPLPENVTINTEIDILEGKIEKAKSERKAVYAELKESRRKLEVYNAGINECKLIKSELEVYGQMKPNSE